MFDALGADQRVGQPFYFGGFATNHDHLQAMVVVEVNVQRSDDQVLKIVLCLDQLVVQKPDVMIVDHRDCSDYASCGTKVVT